MIHFSVIQSGIVSHPAGRYNSAKRGLRIMSPRIICQPDHPDRGKGTTMMNYADARRHMVDGQIRTNDVTDRRLVAALGEIPREVFVPKPLRGMAYIDGDIDLGAGRFLMEPLAFAIMVQAAAIDSGDVVLDLGCATGYSAAVLSRLASTVVAVESDRDLAARAGALLGELGFDNVAVGAGALADGDAPHSPYQVIVLEGAVERIPDSLLNQLAEGGRLVAVVRDGPVSAATVVTRTNGTFSARKVREISVRVLPGFERKPSFVF